MVRQEWAAAQGLGAAKQHCLGGPGSAKISVHRALQGHVARSRDARAVLIVLCPSDTQGAAANLAVLSLLVVCWPSSYRYIS